MSLRAIDLFAGIGGNSIAAVDAGLDLVWVANHNPEAVRYHELNHPGVEHSCQDLQQADWGKVPKHDFGLASPCCQGHSDSRGKEGPHHDKSRSTAWAVISSMEYHLPYFQLVENVPKFLQWKLFPHWLSCIKALGYSVSINILDSADVGVPQNRERVFLICTRSKNPIEIQIEKKPHVSVNTILDWDHSRWSLVDKPGRAPNTLARVKSGRERFGDRFVMPYYGSGSGKTGRSLDRPVGVIPTGDRWAVVDGDRMRMFTVDEYRKGMSFPENIILPKVKRTAVHMLGNATCPVHVEEIIKATLKAA